MGSDQVSVRIDRADHLVLLGRQIAALQAGKGKPSLAELIHEAIAKTAETGT